MPRILFVSTSTTLGGAEKTLFCLATRLDPKEFAVAGVVSLKPAGFYAQRLAESGVKTQSLGIRSLPSLKAARALAAIIRRERPDVVHSLMYQAIQLCRFLKRRAGVPFRLVSSPRVSYRSRSTWSLVVDRLLKGADDLLIAESDASRDFLIRKLGYAESRVRTIYNGVDVARRPAAGLERQRKRLELGLGPDDVLLVAVGRLDAQKGHCVLIDAVAELKGFPRLRCAVIGAGPLRGRLEDRIRRLNLERSVRLLGERDDVDSWLSAGEIFVLPSLWEGLPNALLEAMSLGLPVAASAVDGVCEAVAPNISGLLVPPQDAGALARALARLITDPDLRRRLGEAARTRIAERFSLPAMIAGYEAAYREALARRPAK